MSFDFLAPHYDWMEALLAGPRLQRARTRWLDQLAGRRRILSVGEGHGRFAAACARRWPEAEITCVDASARMLARAQARLGGESHHVRWIQGDALTWVADGKYDAIVTDFFLDCFPPQELATVVKRLAAAAAVDATWLVVDFAIPARGVARWRAQSIHRLMYAFFRLTTRLPARRLTPPDELLLAHGFALRGRDESEWGLLRSDWWGRG